MIEACQVRDLRGLRELPQSNPRKWKDIVKFFKGVLITDEKAVGVKGGRKAIKGFDLQGALYEFVNDDGDRVTVKVRHATFIQRLSNSVCPQDHYLRVHNRRLRFPELPGVITRTSPRKEIVPLELCFVEPNQLYKKALSPAVTAEMVRFASTRPDEKRRRVEDAVSAPQVSLSLSDKIRYKGQSLFEL